MKKLRDNQREKCYRAERETLWPIASPLPTVKDVERYIKRQSKRATLVKRYGRAVNLEYELKITDGRGTRNALAHGDYKISLPLWARSDCVALHEWAHIIHKRLNWFGNFAASNVGSRTKELTGASAAHGWQWAAIFLDLVTFCMGKEAGAALKAAFRKHRVRIKPKRKRQPMTPAQYDAMLERMDNARITRRMAKMAA